MLDAIAGIEATVVEATFVEYRGSWTMRRAVERGIEIISEASRHLPAEMKTRTRGPMGERLLRSAPCSGTSMAGPTITLCGESSRNISPN